MARRSHRDVFLDRVGDEMYYELFLGIARQYFPTPADREREAFHRNEWCGGWLGEYLTPDEVEAAIAHASQRDLMELRAERCWR